MPKIIECPYCGKRLLTSTYGICFHIDYNCEKTKNKLKKISKESK